MAETALGQTHQRADIAARLIRLVPPAVGGGMPGRKGTQWPHPPSPGRYPHVRPLVLATSFFLSALIGAPAFAQTPQPAAVQAGQPAAQNEATKVVDDFMTALAGNQLEAARQAMTPNAVVIANGLVLGTRDGYIDGAAKADAAAMKSVRSRELMHRDSQVDARMAWVVSEKRMVGEGAGQLRAMVLTETFLLTKTPSGWKIRGIHWSSRNAG